MVDVSKGKNKFDLSKFMDFCKDNNFIFPKAFVDYLQMYNDGELELNCVEFQENAVNIRYFYGISSEEYGDIRVNYQSYKERLPQACVPIAEDDFGNQICISLNSDTYGKIYFWDHELMDLDEDKKTIFKVDDMFFIANSFEELCSKIQPTDAEDVPHYSPVQIKWNRFVSFLRTQWNKF